MKSINQYHKSIGVTLIWLHMCLAFSSCLGFKKSAPMREDENNKEGDKIVFLLFKMSFDSIQNKNTLTLLEQTSTNGKLKQALSVPENFENYLTLDVIEPSGKKTKIELPHPLFKQFEYEEAGKLISKSIQLKEDKFFVRLQLKGSNKIKIYETIKSFPQRELLSFKL